MFKPGAFDRSVLREIEQHGDPFAFRRRHAIAYDASVRRLLAHGLLRRDEVVVDHAPYNVVALTSTGRAIMSRPAAG